MRLQKKMEYLLHNWILTTNSDDNTKDFVTFVCPQYFSRRMMELFIQPRLESGMCNVMISTMY